MDKTNNEHDNITLSRRDFLKLSGVGVAGLMIPPIQIEKPQLEAKRVNNHNEKIIFDIEREISNEDILKLKNIFDRIAVGMKELQVENTIQNIDDKKLLAEFNPAIFSESTHSYIDKIVRLQKTYKQFKNAIGIDPAVQTEAIDLIRYNFGKLTIPLDVFEQVVNENNDLSDGDIAQMIFFDTKDLVDNIPVDPLIGMDVYKKVGAQVWFEDFDYLIVDGVTLGTYPITKKFLFENGRLFRELSSHTGSVRANKNYSNSRPNQFKFGSTTESLAGYKVVDVDPTVEEEIRKELEEMGIDRSFYKLAVRSVEGQTDIWAFHSSDTPEEINLVIPSNKLDREYYEKYKRIILYGFVHESFHVLDYRTTEMSDFDSYYMQACFKKIYKQTSPLAVNDFIRDKHNLILNGNESMAEYYMLALGNFNEAYRNLYIDSCSYVDSLEVFDKVTNLYSFYLLDGTGLWNSKIFDTNFEDGSYVDLGFKDKSGLAHKSVSWAVNHLKEVIKDDDDKVTNLEKFIKNEIIKLSNEGNMVSDTLFWMNGMSINDYIHKYLPGLVIYKSILNGDNRFLNAVSRDIIKARQNGSITESREEYIMRKIGYLVNLKLEEQGGFIATNTEEHLADQFAYCKINLGFDFRNIASSLSSFNKVQKIRPEFEKLLDFFKKRNLANIPLNV